MVGVLLASKINLDFFYLFFNLLLLCVFAIAGEKYRQKKSNYGVAFSFCVVVFSVIMGLRYKRGFDYAHYVDIFMKPPHSEGHAALVIINSFLKGLGIGPHAAFFFYAVPFVIGGLLFLRYYRAYAHWLFPTFIMATQMFEEYCIRQALSFSFVFLFFHELISSHKFWYRLSSCVVCVLLVVSIHPANAIVIGLFIVGYFISNKWGVIPYVASIPILIFVNYFYSGVLNLDSVMPLLEYFKDLSSLFAHYIQGDAAEQWFGESALQLANERNPLIKALDVIAHASLFYFASVVIRQNSNNVDRVVIILTNFYIIGNIYRNAFLYYELINRMSSVFQMMWFVPFSIVMARVRYQSLNLVRSWMYLAMLFLSYEYLRFLIAPPLGRTMFIWDM